MNRKELNLRIFEGKAEQVLWQPRLETWLTFHRQKGTLPERFRHLEDLEIYDTLGCSVRYGVNVGLVPYDEPPDIERVEKKVDESHYLSIIKMPEGQLHTIYQVVWEDGKIVNRRIKEYAVKTPADFKVLIGLIKRQQFRVNKEIFQQVSALVGKRGEATMFTSSSGFTELIKEWCGLADTFYLLNDYPEPVEEYLQACDERDDRLFDALLQLPCQIFSLGDHATDEFSPPPILKKYLLPRWQKISARLTKEGRYVHSHWDGNSRLILPYLKTSGLHGVEALTPEPMGNITLEEIKQAVGDKIVVLDLIPAIFFLPDYSTQKVLEFTKKVIDMFAPRLILGVSDEISEVGQIKKIEAITELVYKTCGLAE